MSIRAKGIIQILKITHMKERLAGGSQKTFEEAVAYNAKHPFCMPRDKKAIYERIDIKTSFGTYPCIKIKQKNSRNDRGILFTWGGGGLLNAWRSQLGIARRLGKDSGYPVYYPIYLLATEHSLLDTMEMIVQTYQEMTRQYLPENITVIGVSSGGSQALDLVTYINEYQIDVKMPGSLLCVSPGCVPIGEEECKRMEELDKSDDMVSASFVYSFEKISEHWGSYPDWVQHPTVGNYQGLRKARFYYASNETLAFAVDSFAKRMKQQNVEASFYLQDQMFHGFAIYPICKEGKEAYQDILNQLKE